MGPNLPIVDSNVHLWDQARDPVFWLTDRTLLREMMGNYDSLPDRYTLVDYRRDTEGFDVRGIVWSDAGTADPVAAAEWVSRQHDEHGLVTGIVSLGDPADAGFGELVARLGDVALVSSVRIRLAAGLVQGPSDAVPFLERPGVMEHLSLLADAGLVATIEVSSEQVPVVAQLADALPGLRVVLDHFGWPADLSDEGRRRHLDRVADVAARPNVATRIDAMGTIFGAWSTAQLRPWLLAVVDHFGAERCMLGSDMPIERLRGGFGALYRAYGEIFAERSPSERALLFGDSARRWYGS